MHVRGTQMTANAVAKRVVMKSGTNLDSTYLKKTNHKKILVRKGRSNGVVGLRVICLVDDSDNSAITGNGG